MVKIIGNLEISGNITSTDVNYFNEINYGVVPIGSYFTMLALDSGSVTSISDNKLINSGASFNDYYLNKVVQLDNYYVANTYSVSGSTSEQYQLAHTWTFDASEVKGVTFTKISNTIDQSSDGFGVYCYYKLYYTDSTIANTSSASEQSIDPTPKTYTNPNPTKKVWKIELYLRQTRSGASSTAKYHRFYLNGSATVTAIDSTTQLSLSEDVFIISGLYYNFYLFNPNSYELCDGGPVTNVDSELYGFTKPNISNTYIRVI